MTKRIWLLSVTTNAKMKSPSKLLHSSPYAAVAYRRTVWSRTRLVTRDVRDSYLTRQSSTVNVFIIQPTHSTRYLTSISNSSRFALRRNLIAEITRSLTVSIQNHSSTLRHLYWAVRKWLSYSRHWDANQFMLHGKTANRVPNERATRSLVVAYSNLRYL